MKKLLMIGVLLFVVVLAFFIYNSNELGDRGLVMRTVNYNGNELMVSVDGVSVESLPSSGNYYLVSYKCSNDNTKVTWDRVNYKLNVSNGGKKGNVACNLKFASKPELSDMEIGSYVAYIGNGGKVGDAAVSCHINGDASSNVENAETESPNSCSGQNAREDLDKSGYTYGYCYNSNYKYYTTGWRIAYKEISDTGDVNPVIISAGSPECNVKVNSTANKDYIQLANTRALKYCNSKYVDGDCVCIDDDKNGLCDSSSSDAWAISDYDFYSLTKNIGGVGKRLADLSSDLGDVGGMLGDIVSCYEKYSYQECGYNNNLIDNGGYYWFASHYNSTGTGGLGWSPFDRGVVSVSDKVAFGLRPLIKLSSSVYVTGGSGTMDDPYTISND